MKTTIVRFFCLNFVLVTIASAKIYKPMVDLGQLYSRETRGKSAHTVQQLGLKEYQSFIDMDVNSYGMHSQYNTDSRKPVFISWQQANATLRAANKNPVVSLHSYNKYDPNNQGIGFCFGRAMFVDLYLSMNGFNRASIKKAFVVGPMTSGDGASWGWHVTTIAQATDARKNEIWLAIDPIMGRVMEVKEWYRETLKMSSDGKLRLYITDSSKFAHTASSYDEYTIHHKDYNQYFSDMMKWFERSDVTTDLRMQ